MQVTELHTKTKPDSRQSRLHFVVGGKYCVCLSWQKQQTWQLSSVLFVHERKATSLKRTKYFNICITRFQVHHNTKLSQLDGERMPKTRTQQYQGYKPW